MLPLRRKLPQRHNPLRILNQKQLIINHCCKASLFITTASRGLFEVLGISFVSVLTPTFWQHDILHIAGLLEQRRDLLIRESGYAAADAGDEER